MNIVQAGINASFSYPTTDQQTGLFPQASIFDITGGGLNLIGTQPLANIVNGFYYGTFAPAAGKIYLVIVANYTDNTYATVDTQRPPWAEVYKESSNSPGFFAFNYGVFDQEALFIGAIIYDVTTGLTFVTKVPMAPVLAGVYFGTYQGTQNHAYEVLKFVYTDNTYDTISDNWSPGSDEIGALPTSSQNIPVPVPYPVAAQFQAQLSVPQLVAEIEIEPDLST